MVAWMKTVNNNTYQNIYETDEVIVRGYLKLTW